MESKLTKKIKAALINYKSILGNMRTVRWAEEVNVITGYVDFIRFENYIKNEDEVYLCGKNNNPISSERNKFVGNKNYYVLPKELFNEVEKLIPKEIGIILFYKNGSLRLKKESAYKEISKENLNVYLFNALKKWCDLKNNKRMY
ncbi:TPA: hypothetical protein I9094_002809 [Clostridium perfringens]|nr:hypothetical protein [Clostridium perfringens]HAT4346807.1 hypothetical protein [Clostridium perfringens]